MNNLRQTELIFHRPAVSKALMAHAAAMLLTPLLLFSACTTPPLPPVESNSPRIVVDEKASAEAVAAIARHYEFERYADLIKLADAWRTSQLPAGTNVLVALAGAKMIDDEQRFGTALLEVENKYPQAVLVKLEAGIYLQKRGRRSLATSYFNEVIASTPLTLMDRRARAYALAHLGKYERSAGEQALNALAALIESGDNSPITLFYDGAVAHDLKRHARAVQSLRRALAVNPNQRDSLIALGVALDESGKHTEAIRELTAALQKYPREGALHMHLGAAYLSLRQWQDAETALAKAVELLPRSAFAIANLAEAHMRLGRRESALRLARGAVSMAPDDEYAWVVQAAIAHETGRVKLKNEAITKLKTVAPDAAMKLAARKFDLRAFLKAP
jgi:tetratricopeptide (TPR) repeat protein